MTLISTRLIKAGEMAKIKFVTPCHKFPKGKKSNKKWQCYKFKKFENDKISICTKFAQNPENRLKKA